MSDTAKQMVLNAYESQGGSATDFQRGVNREFNALGRGGLPDIATGIVIHIPFIPAIVT